MLAPVCAPKIDELDEALVSGLIAGCALEELDLAWWKGLGKVRIHAMINIALNVIR